MYLRAFLVASALLWSFAGAASFIEPGLLSAAAGVSARTVTGTIELRATYGGITLALGVLAAAALFRRALRRPALVAFAFVCGGLFMARLLAVLLGLEVSAYTAAALLFEILWTVFAVRLLDEMRRREHGRE